MHPFSHNLDWTNTPLRRGDEEEDMTPLTFSELVSSNDISSVLDLNHVGSLLSFAVATNDDS